MKSWLIMVWLAGALALSAGSLAAQSILDIECRSSHNEGWNIRHLNETDAVFFYSNRHGVRDLVSVSYASTDAQYVYDAREFTQALREEARAQLQNENRVYDRLYISRTSATLHLRHEHVGFTNHDNYDCAVIPSAIMDAALEDARSQFTQAVEEALQREQDEQQAVRDAQKF